MVTFTNLQKEYGEYSKDGIDYAIAQNPYLEYIAGRSTAYVVGGETYYTAIGYDREGNPYRLWWGIAAPDAEDASAACDWEDFDAQPIPADPAPWAR